MAHPLYIAFIWHMHQPYYRDLATGQSLMPWARLHGTKDYLDMVKCLEQFPTIHQTFNLVPSLIDQLEEYLPPANLSDQYLELSRKPAAELTEAEKRFILENFFMANWDHMVKPYPRYHDLLVKRGTLVEEGSWPEVLKRFKPQDYLDLQVWFNLGWIDPWLKAQDAALAKLITKESQFTESDKQLVLDTQRSILQQIVPTYRQAQDRGQIELSTSPYYHPIMPLVCDLRAAHVALPHLQLPDASFRHPEDAAWHLTQALARHEALFGRRPGGMWPPEGAVSEELVRLAIDAKLKWIATDEEILWRTLKTARAPSLLYRPHLLRRKGGALAIVFRDRELSDLIGFVYSQWKATIAIQDFVKRLEGIYQQFRAATQPALVSVILDGENAWEFYPRDGQEFLHGLYQALANDERFRLVTVQEFLTRCSMEHSQSLPDLFAGSWIDGNFATWIGHPEKNAAWKHLATVRQHLTAAPHPSQAAWQSFYVAEGSDWMWWFGDTHSSAQDEEFDRLFRAHLGNVYRFLGEEAPVWLQLPIKTKVIQPAYEPTASIHPTLDGLETSYYEWLYAGRLDLRKGYAAIHRGKQLLQAMAYGFDDTHYYFRLDVDVPAFAHLETWRIQLDFLDRHQQIQIHHVANSTVTAQLVKLPGQARGSTPSEGVPSAVEGGRGPSREVGPHPQPLACAYQRVLEFAVLKTLLSVKPGEAFQLRITLFQGADPIERYPAHGAFRMPIPSADFEAQVWSV
jgi:alpha-amylase/alpha-mannosidase (GH57 family)